ncbi:MAG: hypothetical protein JWL84_897 [Rhodospirillales bacterium]|nr:hypothetical protein [Rhodospirillales bacterium]
MSAPIALPPSAIPMPTLPTAAATATPPSVTVLDGAAQALAALAGGATLSGTVAPGSVDGAITLLTALGTLSLAANLPLPAGAVLTLQAQQANPGTVLILTVNGTAAAAPPAVEPIAPPPGAPIRIELGSIVAATVVALPPAVSAAAAPPATSAPAPAATLLPGTVVPGTVVPGTVTPAAIAPGAARAAVPLWATAQNGTTVPPPPTPARDAAAPPDASGAPIMPPTARPLPAGTSLALRVLAVQPAPSPPAADGTVTSSPMPALTGVVRATTMPGTVPLVDTPAGPLLLRGAPPLPAGTRVALRLLPDARAAAELTVLPDAATAAGPIPGQPPAAAATSPTASAPATVSKGEQPSAQPPTAQEPQAQMPAPATRPALSVTGAAPPQATGTAPPTAAPPTQAQSRAAPLPITSAPPVAVVEAPATTLPSASPSAPQTSIQGTPALSARPLLPVESATPHVATAETAPSPSAPLVVRVVLASPPSAPGRPAEQIVTGTVLPDQSGGRAPLLVATPLGVLAVTPRLAAPSGSLLLLAAPDLVAPPLGIADDRAPRPEKGWTSLVGALPALEHASPALAGQLRADLAPQAGGDRLAATFLFLIDALRPGGPAWPGALVAKALAAGGHGDAAAGLAENLGEARRIAAASATGAWQVFMLPFVEGPMLQPLRLYLKRRDQSRRDAAGESARFILEFELSRLGALQLDGFVRPRRLDLLLRTKAPLGAALESAVERIFHDRVAAAGLGGTIDFATVARFDIAPLDGMRERVGLAV